jgi:hypothetical protein
MITLSMMMYFYLTVGIIYFCLAIKEFRTEIDKFGVWFYGIFSFMNFIFFGMVFYILLEKGL